MSSHLLLCREARNDCVAEDIDRNIVVFSYILCHTHRQPWPNHLVKPMYSKLSDRKLDLDSKKRRHQITVLGVSLSPTFCEGRNVTM